MFKPSKSLKPIKHRTAMNELAVKQPHNDTHWTLLHRHAVVRTDTEAHTWKYFYTTNETVKLSTTTGNSYNVSVTCTLLTFTKQHRLIIFTPLLLSESKKKTKNQNIQSLISCGGSKSNKDGGISLLPETSSPPRLQAELSGDVLHMNT
jgi:hypothetical protein